MAQQKTFAVLVILLFLGAGVFIGSLAGGFVGQLTTPSSHNAIIGKIRVKDTKANLYLTPKFVCSKTVTWGKGIPLSIFTSDYDYQQSTWIWQRYDDTEFVMTIWGPGNDGKSYLIEFGRLAADPFTISFEGETVITIAEVTDTINRNCEGYYSIMVEIL